MFKVKKFVDLSWDFTAETPIYPGDPEPSVEVAATLDKEGYTLSRIVSGTQTGSHVDAPYHFSNEGEADKFATGDEVIFDDAAELATVSLAEAVEPSSVVFKNEEKTYILTGAGSIAGETGLTKQGDGTLTIGTANTYTGKTLLAGGQTNISALANSITPSGAFGAYTTEKGKLEIRNGATLRNTAAVTNGTPITIGEGGGTLQTQGNFTMQAAFDGGVLTKTGAGELAMATARKVVIE